MILHVLMWRLMNNDDYWFSIILWFHLGTSCIDRNRNNQRNFPFHTSFFNNTRSGRRDIKEVTTIATFTHAQLNLLVGLTKQAMYLVCYFPNAQLGSLGHKIMCPSDTFFHCELFSFVQYLSFSNYFFWYSFCSFLPMFLTCVRKLMDP